MFYVFLTASILDVPYVGSEGDTQDLVSNLHLHVAPDVDALETV